MNGININFASNQTPIASNTWSSSLEEDRIVQIELLINNYDKFWKEKFKIVSANDKAYVTMEFIKSIPVDERSSYFLRLESILCQEIDPSITIWISPVGDKSSLRNLRGIEVKTTK